MKTIDDLLYEWFMEYDIPSGVSRWEDGSWHYIDARAIEEFGISSAT